MTPKQFTKQMNEWELECWHWYRSQYGNRWKAHLFTKPNDIFHNKYTDYRHFHWKPFGIDEWNKRIFTLRLFFDKIGMYKYIHKKDFDFSE